MRASDRSGAFIVRTSAGTLLFPYAKTEPPPGPDARVVRVWIDAELGREAFSYTLHSGQEGTVHIEQVQEYNRDPSYLRDTLLYSLTMEVQKRIAASRLSKREIIRRLGTSPAQLYRLLDQTNYRKSVDQLLRLLHVLGAEVEIVLRAGGRLRTRAA